MTAPLLVATKAPLIRPDACGGCKFYEASPNPTVGQCHRMPPTLVLIPGKEMRFGTEFPSVQPDKNWCGEWRVRITVN